jgi:CHASE2 domain-containing sensor protein
MFNINIIIIESVIYIFVSVFIGIILRGEDLKKFKRLILLFYLIIGIAVYSVLYFVILSVAVIIFALFILKILEY